MRELIRDYTIYVVVGVALVFTILWGAAHGVDASWLILPWYTLFVFGFVVGAYIGWIRSKRFWMVVAALIALHLIGYTAALIDGFRLQAGWTWVLFPAELAAIDAALGYFGIRPRLLRKRKASTVQDERR